VKVEDWGFLNDIFESLIMDCFLSFLFLVFTNQFSFPKLHKIVALIHATGLFKSNFNCA